MLGGLENPHRDSNVKISTITAGCIDPVACNYDPLATEDDGSCQYIGDPCSDGSICTFGDTIDANCNCVGVPVNCDDGNPCTDDTCDPATGCLNINITSNCDDGNACTYNDTCFEGSCAGIPIDCDDGDPCTTDTCDPAVGCINTPLPDTDGDGICDLNEIVGCQDNTACNYDPSATDAGNCDYPDACGVCGGLGIDGCTDLFACNFDPSATCDDGSCIPNGLGPNGGGEILWQENWGGTGNEQTNNFIPTSDGGYLMAAQTSSSNSGDVSIVNQGMDDIWLVKMDASLSIQWQRSLGGSGRDFIGTGNGLALNGELNVGIGHICTSGGIETVGLPSSSGGRTTSSIEKDGLHLKSLAHG